MSLRRRLATRWGLPRAEEPVVISGPPASSTPPTSLRVMVWNIQFGAGRDHLFFYDGGMAVSVSRQTVVDTLAAIAGRIRLHDPDLVLLQEVDRGSRRTAFLDEHRMLLELLPAYRWHASTPYHRVPYVPAPVHEHLGRVDMHLSALSKVPLEPGIRWQLPVLRESAIRRLFNLRRCVMDLPIPLGTGHVRILHTHLSAFSRGDGTVRRQVATLRECAARARNAGDHWLLTGDFNALPPGDDLTRLGPRASTLYGQWSPLSPLFGEALSAVPLRLHAEDPAPYRTWVPHGESIPDRAIDHAFCSRTLRFDDVSVDRASVGLSDHLPLLFTLSSETRQ